jgi:hypothetical protein
LGLLELVLRLVPLLDLNLELVPERFDAGFGRFDLFLRGSGGDVGGADDGEGEDRGDREPPDPYRPASRPDRGLPCLPALRSVLLFGAAPPAEPPAAPPKRKLRGPVTGSELS